MKPFEQNTYDFQPTMTDTQVLEFCKNGYWMFEGIVPDEINNRTMEYCDQYTSIEPSGILKQDWFVENVIANPIVAGAVRSLLGVDFHLPILMSNHRVTCPIQSIGGWHVDGNYRYTPELNFLQVFYYPQDTSIELGPTQILPGSHLIQNKAKFMAHLGNIQKCDFDGSACWFHFPDHLPHLASSWHFNPSRHSQPPQVFLLAHNITSTRLGH